MWTPWDYWQTGKKSLRYRPSRFETRLVSLRQNSRMKIIRKRSSHKTFIAKVLTTAPYLANPELPLSKCVNILSELCLKSLCKLVSIGLLITEKSNGHPLIILHYEHLVNAFKRTGWENKDGINRRVKIDSISLTFRGFDALMIISHEIRSFELCVQGWRIGYLLCFPAFVAFHEWIGFLSVHLSKKSASTNEFSGRLRSDFKNSGERNVVSGHWLIWIMRGRTLWNGIWHELQVKITVHSCLSLDVEPSAHFLLNWRKIQLAHSSVVEIGDRFTTFQEILRLVTPVTGERRTNVFVNSIGELKQVMTYGTDDG
jgi:hypothetical protein